MDKTSKDMIKKRVKQLFNISDRERKGFIVKRDMQRMRNEVTLTPQQLEDVFDTLDAENSGVLKLENFIRGFSNYVANHLSTETEYQAGMEPGCSIDQEQDQYQDLITRIADTQILENTQSMRQLCDDVNELGSQQLQLDLEATLIDLLKDLRRQKRKLTEMEERMKKKDKSHNVELRKLFEEMEFHLNDAKSKMATQIDNRLRQVRTELEEELALKAEELKEVTSQKHRVSLRLHIIKASEATLRRDNAKLAEQKVDLEEKCERQAREMKMLRQKMTQHLTTDQNKHMAAGFRLAQCIIAEEQGLLQQLRTLKTITKTLEEGRNQETETTAIRSNQEMNGLS